MPDSGAHSRISFKPQFLQRTKAKAFAAAASVEVARRNRGACDRASRIGLPFDGPAEAKRRAWFAAGMKDEGTNLFQQRGLQNDPE